MSDVDEPVGDDASADDHESADPVTDQPETRLPADASPWTCPHCGFQLPAEREYQLHLGLEHYGRLAAAEQEAFKTTYREEEAALDRFRILALGGLVLLYFGFLLVYALLAA